MAGPWRHLETKLNTTYNENTTHELVNYCNHCHHHQYIHTALTHSLHIAHDIWHSHSLHTAHGTHSLHKAPGTWHSCSHTALTCYFVSIGEAHAEVFLLAGQAEKCLNLVVVTQLWVSMEENLALPKLNDNHVYWLCIQAVQLNIVHLKITKALSMD